MRNEKEDSRFRQGRRPLLGEHLSVLASPREDSGHARTHASAEKRAIAGRETDNDEPEWNLAF
jgi:hypothetical protein